jgi:hypothetical protein
MKPHDYFDVTRADEVAECWEGVIKCEGLYEALWDIANATPPLPNKEDNGPYDYVGMQCLSLSWNELSPEHQRHLNALAIQRAEEVQKWISR